MSDWQALAREAEQWAAEGKVADLWWRDDDAADTGPALDRLLGLHRSSGVPLALAVVPAQATAALAARLADEPGVDLLQHGYAHANHAMPPAKKIELGLERPAMLVLGELGTGQMALERLFGTRPLPVLVPPWNRIASPALAQALPQAGLRGLSRFGPRAAVPVASGVVEVNTHVDIIDWRGGRGFAGEAACLGQALAHLQARRLGTVDAREPTGWLTHHAVHDAPAWDFLQRLLARTAARTGVHWVMPGF